jgi:hypothetical protein
MSSTAMSGAKVSASRTAAKPSWAIAVRQPSSSNIVARLLALSTLSSTTSTRCRRCGRASTGRGRDWRAGRLRDRRQADREARAAVLALALGMNAAAVHLDQLLHQCQADAEAALGPFDAAVDLGEHVEHPRQHRRRMPMPESSTVTTA